MRKWRGLFSLLGIIFLTIVINTYRADSQKEVKFPPELYGIPTYENSRLSNSMSSFNGNPYIAVFLAFDDHDTVVRYYKEKLKIDYKLLEYGNRGIVTTRIYQFRLADGELPDSISKGVEVMTLNGRSQRVLNAKSKIKIYIPRKEVLEAQQKQQNKK